MNLSKVDMVNENNNELDEKSNNNLFKVEIANMRKKKFEINSQCDIIVVGKSAVFLIQNIFPTTGEYILEKYITENKDVENTCCSFWKKRNKFYTILQKICYCSKPL